MRSKFVACGVAASALMMAFGPSASGQEEVTTTVPPETTVPATTVAPETTVAPVTTAAPETTVAPETTLAPTTTQPVAPTIPGYHVTGGKVTFGATFKESGQCGDSGNLAGQQMNVVLDNEGSVQGAFGMSSLDGGGQVGLIVADFGVVPLGVAVYRSTGTCENDVIALGSTSRDANGLSLQGWGIGIYPEDLANFVAIDVDVTSKAEGGVLDLGAATSFFTAKRG